MTSGSLILITGPAAVGKSTVARSLQSLLSETGHFWLVVELDTFARGLSRKWISWGGHRGEFADRGFTYARGDDGSIDLHLGSDGRRLLAAFHRSVAAIVRTGVDVICEAIVHDEEDWRDWLEALDRVPTQWIALTAPRDVLADRERTERRAESQGLARGMLARDPAGHFDLLLDTHRGNARSVAQRIVDWLPKEPEA